MACFGTYIGALHNKTSISTMYVGRDSVTGDTCELQTFFAKTLKWLAQLHNLLMSDPLPAEADCETC